MPARDDPNPRVAAICLSCISLISAVMTVYFPRFSCFYELRDIDNYTIELNVGVFGCCFLFSTICILLWLKWPHSKAICYFSQVCIFIFCFGTSLYGISVFSILDIANNEINSDTYAGTNTDDSPALKAAMKLLSPDRNLEQDWNEGERNQNRDNLCRLQKQFQCIMWRPYSSDTCILNETSSLSSSSSSKSDIVVHQEDDMFARDVDEKNTQPSENVTCLTCGIFTMNISETSRPPSCFAAMVSCFMDGREKYATTLENPGSVYKYVADKYVMLAGSILILVLFGIAFWKNCDRDFTQPAGYGDWEHGVGGGVESDYKALTTAPKYY